MTNYVTMMRASRMAEIRHLRTRLTRSYRHNDFDQARDISRRLGQLMRGLSPAERRQLDPDPVEMA